MKSKSRNDSPFRSPAHQSRTTTATPVQYVKGVGPARAKLLKRLNIESIEDLLFYFPWRYEDRRQLKKIADLTLGIHETTLGEVVSARVITTPRKRMKIFEVTVQDGSGTLRARWFNQPFLKKYFEKGSQVILSGVVRGNPYSGSGLELESPDYELMGSDDQLIHSSRIIPVYGVTEGISPKQLRTVMFHAVTAHMLLVEEYLPDEIVSRSSLKALPWAVREAHFPEEVQDLSALNQGTSMAHRRLVFDEFFLLEAGLALMKKREEAEQGLALTSTGVLTEPFFASLPYALTKAQQRVIGEIQGDMQRPLPMNRLVHGDVGCGKTTVALAAMLIAVENSYQACLMAPTELLAEQHYRTICSMIEPLGLQVTLLTSGKKEGSAEALSDGAAQIVVGTHALIQESVRFHKLGLAVIDEQHRFGVAQRAALRSKGQHPDILVMTATPIPRTLALTLYGDLDIAVIDELPAGRKAVMTEVFFPSQKEKVYSLINTELEKGRQVYIVYPLIEESEKLDLKSAMEGAEAWKRMFPGKNIALVHGKMHHDERNQVMNRFKDGEIDVLVATTVIEVGIDVPNASLMMVVHAERFGLAQLHQLRGRIGRGEYESYCLLMAFPPLSEEGRRRLKAMESTGDGFKIAEEDLAIRGPGDFFGTRQSGIPELRVANILRDIAILEEARKEAFQIIEGDPLLQQYPLLRERLDKKWMGRLELVKS